MASPLRLSEEVRARLNEFLDDIDATDTTRGLIVPLDRDEFVRLLTGVIVEFTYEEAERDDPDEL